MQKTFFKLSSNLLKLFLLEYSNFKCRTLLWNIYKLFTIYNITLQTSSNLFHKLLKLYSLEQRILNTKCKFLHMQKSDNATYLDSNCNTCVNNFFSISIDPQLHMVYIHIYVFCLNMPSSNFSAIALSYYACCHLIRISFFGFWCLHISIWNWYIYHIILFALVI